MIKRKTKYYFIIINLFVYYVLIASHAFAQTPTYSCDIRNCSFISSRIFDFDIYLTQTGSTPLELAEFNTGILLNTGFVNGGIIMPALQGGSELNASQVPLNVGYDAEYFCLKIAPRIPPRNPATGITAGTLISNTYGTRVCHIRLTNSVDFGNDPLAYSWNMNLMPYHTLVAAFIPGAPHPVNVAVTSAVSHSRSGNLIIFLEGLYITGIGNHKAKDENGYHFAGPVADVISVRLASSTFPFSTVYSNSNVLLYTNGKCSVSVPGSLTGSYYIVINHRNSIETWSSTPVSLAQGTINYDFSSAVTQAFGNNLKITKDGIFAIFGGDISQDGAIDGTDIAATDNASAAIIHGYLPVDVNGDGIVDGSDMAIIDNNSTAIIHTVKPLH